MKMLLFMISLLTSLATYANQGSSKVFSNEDSNMLMQTAIDNGINLDSLKSTTDQLANYVAKDAIYIPTGGVFLFEDKNKNLMAVTTTGRYTIQGTVVDVLKRKQMNTVSEIRDDYLIKLEESPFPLKTVASFEFGNPSINLQAALFISLDCIGCEKLIEQLYKIRDKIRISVVLVPTPGEASVKLRQLWCSKQESKITDYDLIQWLRAVGRADIDKKLLTHEQSKKCEVVPLVTSLSLASIYNVQGLPSVVRSDGLLGNGFPIDYIKWLALDVQPLFKNPFEKK